MKESTLRPRVHVFVCTNARADDDPLGSGCGARGEEVFFAMKRATRSHAGELWVARTGCLGLCPKTGCTVAVQPARRYLVEVEPHDVPTLVAAIIAGR